MIEASASAAMHIWHPREFDPPRIYVVGLRHSPLPRHELVLRREGDWRFHEDGRLPLRGAGGVGEQPRSRLTAVQRAVLKVGAPAKTAALIKALQCSRRTGERWLTEAVQRGEIRAVERGVYALAGLDDAARTAKSSANSGGSSGGMVAAA